MKKNLLKTIFFGLLVALVSSCSKYDDQTQLLTGKDWVHEVRDDETEEFIRYDVIRFYPENYFMLFSVKPANDEYDYDFVYDGKYYKIEIEDDFEEELQKGLYSWMWENEIHTLLKLESNCRFDWQRVEEEDDNRKDLLYGDCVYAVTELAKNNLTLTYKSVIDKEEWCDSCQLIVRTTDTISYEVNFVKNDDLLKKTSWNYDDFYKNYIKPLMEE